MAQILQRDSESGGNGNLTTGAIAGIAGGIGALFLGAAGLFLVYWRRQRQFDREENYSQDSFDEMGPPVAMAPAVTYTHDYKMDNQHHEGDQTSSYTYSPDKPAYSFSPLGSGGHTSAMPTHPAYIPRALVRGTTPSLHSTSTNTPRQFPSPALPSSSKNQLDDNVIQAYLAAAAAAQATSSSPPPAPSFHPQDQDIPRESDTSLRGLPIRPHQRQSPTQIPAFVLPAFPSPPADTTTSSGPAAGKKSRSYIPPRLNLSGPSATSNAPPGARGPDSGGDKPLSGRENTTISGPLAFPQHYQPPPPSRSESKSKAKSKSKSPKWRSKWDREQTDDDLYGEADDTTPGQSDGWRTFRSRAQEQQQQQQQEQQGRDEGKKHARKRSDRNSGNRHYAEIEIGRGSDIW
jgi:hypothetical protein